MIYSSLYNLFTTVLMRSLIAFEIVYTILGYDLISSEQPFYQSFDEIL